MSEIKKMYKNAGIGKRCISKDSCHKDFVVCLRCCAYSHPPFTAEKQIAILQLLTQRCDLTISHFSEWEFIHYDGQEPLEITGEDFTETFAKLINVYWQDLTTKERTEIAEILKG